MRALRPAALAVSLSLALAATPIAARAQEQPAGPPTYAPAQPPYAPPPQPYPAPYGQPAPNGAIQGAYEQRGAEPPPAFLPYQQGQPIPPGYRLVSKRNTATGIIGVALFGLSYGVTYYVGAIASAVESGEEDKKAPLLFVPLAGPLLFGSAVDAEGHGMFWLSVLSAGQVAGVITALVGFTSTTERLYRNDVLAQPAKPRVDVAPILTAHFQGVGLSGSF